MKEQKYNTEACIRLLCAIAEMRSKQYRKAYAEWLKNPDRQGNKQEKERWELRLKKQPTELTSGQIARLQHQVEEEQRRKEEKERRKKCNSN